MKKLFYIPILLIILFFSCQKKEITGYMIDGKLENLTDSVLYVISSDSFKVLDTIPCQKDGKFIIQGNADQLSATRIFSEQTGVLLTTWVQNGDKISVTGNIRIPEQIKIKGNEVNDRLTEFKILNKNLLKERTDLFYKKEIGNRKDTLSGEFKELNYISKISNINHQLKDKANQFIKANPSSMASVILMKDYLMDTDSPEKMKELLSLITGEEARNSDMYKKMYSLFEKLNKTSVGQKAPEFRVSDLHNDSLNLSSFEGKYLLLTFAASWCDVCETDNKELVSIYKEFNKEGLEILTISLDENKTSWISVAKKNGIVWHQVVDVHGWGSKMVDLYNVDHVPSNYLIDKNGIIVAKNEYGDNLKEIIKKELTMEN